MIRDRWAHTQHFHTHAPINTHTHQSTHTCTHNPISIHTHTHTQTPIKIHTHTHNHTETYTDTNHRTGKSILEGCDFLVCIVKESKPLLVSHTMRAGPVGVILCIGYPIVQLCVCVCVCLKLKESLLQLDKRNIESILKPSPVCLSACLPVCLSACLGISAS